MIVLHCHRTLWRVLYDEGTLLPVQECLSTAAACGPNLNRPLGISFSAYDANHTTSHLARAAIPAWEFYTGPDDVVVDSGAV